MKNAATKRIPYNVFIDKYEESPFLKGFVVNETTKVNKIANIPGIEVRDMITRAIKENIKVVYASESSLDGTPFAKIYNFDFHFIIDLSKMARNIIVFLFDYNRIKYNNNIIIFDIEDFVEKTGFSNTTSIYAAIKELINYGFWAKNTINGIYWLNQDCLFVGERRRLIYNKHNKANKDKSEFYITENDEKENENPLGFGITKES